MAPAKDCYKVHPYSQQRLLALIAANAGASPKTLSQKDHPAYLHRYFTKLQAQTILVELEYFDRDYLEDYAAYYARCFTRYKRRSVRLHFFSMAFTKRDFQGFLRNEETAPLNDPILQASYIGFVVVRPLPSTMFGRSCLKTYPPNDLRSFPTTRRYEANLFGHPLAVESLAFQEQDQAVAACATSALWSAFQKTGRLFQHPMPSLVEITEAANRLFPLSMRSIPSKGLTIEQMAGAVRYVGLEPFLMECADLTVLRKSIYAYINAHIPILLTFHLFRLRLAEQPSCLGLHATTVTGYSLADSGPPAAGCSFLCDRVQKIYVHDDQIGPFARMDLDDQILNIGNEALTSAQSAWGDDYRIVPKHLLIPLYHKIRMPIEQPLADITPLVQFLDVTLRRFDTIDFLKGLECDLSLTALNDFRADCAQKGRLKGKALEEVLCRPLPRFLWKASLRRKGLLLFDFLYDATDVQSESRFLTGIEYAPGAGAIFGHLFDISPQAFSTVPDGFETSHAVQFLKNHCQKATPHART